MWINWKEITGLTMQQACKIHPEVEAYSCSGYDMTGICQGSLQWGATCPKQVYILLQPPPANQSELLAYPD